MKILWLLNRDSVREVCVENDFYTCGSNEDYEKILTKVDEKKNGMTAEEVSEIAKDIAAHTDGEDFKFVCECLLNKGYALIE